MKRIKFYQTAIILSLSLSAIVLAAEGKRPAALGAPEEAATVQPVQSVPAAPAAAANEPAAVAEVNQSQFPYVGEITGTNLNLRSGPGMNFYSCGKISMPTRVVVVGEKFSWSQILPPPGSFSWIFKQYVQVDNNKPEVGIVNAENVRVYAGADDRDAMVSDSVQITLDKGQKVRIVGQAVGDYYKIAPPEGATLWTSSQYLKFVRKADEIDIKLPKADEPKTATYSKPGVMMDQVDPNNRMLEEYYVLVKQLDDEKTKPLTDQNYSNIRSGLEALAANPDGGKSAEYAQEALKTVTRYELARQSADVLESHKSDLQKQLDEIEKERQKKRQSVRNTAKYAVTGVFKASAVYQGRPDIKRALVMDETDTPICYAQPAGGAENLDMSKFYGKKVGLVGELSTDPMSNFALIKFTDIQLLETEEPAQE
ncbi:MAG: hypothetical protein A2Y10_17085 [Planctomycetes bacterium GWF2_41_51]|nr:MAG: hypothetical protein A2Y10_17085 [Planctomycetes bacterium GWF2_41_51]HBG27162.1 hypothetical protein [Phycisphaerales bacterium]